jgi:DNA polymerase I
MAKTVIIFDSSYLVFRSHFIHPHIKHEGFSTGALFGFYKTVNSIIIQYKPDYIYFAKDLPEPTWRHDFYPDYKAGRSTPDPEMILQFPIINLWTELIATQSLSVSKYEADDIIATLATKLNNDATIDNIYIFSSDKDLYQLLTLEKVTFWQKDGFKFTKTDFIIKYGVQPEDWVLFKSLCGDPSDNIKGVMGIGPKTASIYINNPEKLNQSVIEKIENSQDILERNLKLCKLSIIDDLKLQFDNYNLEAGNELLIKYGIKIMYQKRQSTKVEIENLSEALF